MSLVNLIYKLENLICHNKIMKRIKQRRCRDCIHVYRRGCIFACYMDREYLDYDVIQPLRLICFRRKRKVGEKGGDKI